MAAVLGAIKGAWRGLILFVAIAVFPALAWIVAGAAHEALHVDFAVLFFAVLALEFVLGVCALFGLAADVEKTHADDIDRKREEAQREA